MPSKRHTDTLPPARDCKACKTSHRPGGTCPPPGRWLVGGGVAVPAVPIRVAEPEK